MTFAVRKAVRSRRPLKISLEGLSGSGKTFTLLRLAFAMRRAGLGSRIVVADSENESAGLYAGVEIDGERWDYEVCPIPAAKQTPAGYAEVYEYLVGEGYDIVGIDSMSHAWHGAMEQVDAHAARNKGDKFGAWAKVTPDQRRMLTTLTDPRAHLIATMRVKAEYERVEGQNGKDKIKIKKVGLKTDQREGTEYEFDAVVRLDLGHDAVVEKVRGCTAMDGRTGTAPGPDFWQPLFRWWLSAEPTSPPPPAAAPLTHDALAAGIRAAADLDALKAAFAAVNARENFPRLTAAEVAALTALKDDRKAALAPPTTPAPEQPPAEPVEVRDEQAFHALLRRKGQSWPNALARLALQFKAAHSPAVLWANVSADQRKWLVAEVAQMPDVIPT